MADVVDPATRSRMMSGIRGKNTKPEMAIRLGLYARGFRYRLHAVGVPGKPDIWLPRYRAAVFVNGCFWHGHDCALFKLPGTREEFWRTKINANQARDARVAMLFAETKLRRLVIWECSFRGPGRIGLDDTLERASSWLLGDEDFGEIRGAS